jgi:hypothetical protein
VIDSIRAVAIDVMDTAARTLVGWRLSVPKLHRWVEDDNTIGDGREVLVQSEPIAGVWVVTDHWAPGMSMSQRPNDPRLLRCLVESTSAYEYIDVLDIIDGDLGDIRGRDPLGIPSLRLHLLHVDLPSFVPALIAAVVLGESVAVAGRTFSELDFEIRPTSNA